MIDIDFLPQTYHEERARRAQVFKRWVMILLVALTLVGWGVTRQRDSAKLAWRADALEAQAHATLVKQSEMDKLRKEKTSLAYQMKIQQQLDQPVAVTQAVAVIGQLLPPSAGLTQIKIQTHRPPPIPLPDPDANKKKRKSKGKDFPEPPAEDFLEIDIYGLAPDDIVVAQIMNVMSDHPIFEKVTMHYSRTDERDGLISSRFHIGAKVPLDRKYVPLHQTAEVKRED